VTHWSDRCYSWDVVNEALNSNGTFMDSIFYQVIGEEYFFTAFKAASDAVKATGKDIKLYYNDYGIESPGNKTTAAAGLMAELQARGIRVDGVGFESHFEVGGTPSKSQQMAAMAQFAALGLDVVQTEIDVRFTSLPYNDTGLAVQKQNYYDTVSACMGSANCLAMTVWDFVDEYSWVPSTFTGQGGADLYGLYSQNYTRKPAYDGCAEAIQGVPCTNCLTAFPPS
jgi:endo-1,4-beta-xylanase